MDSLGSLFMLKYTLIIKNLSKYAILLLIPVSILLQGQRAKAEDLMQVYNLARENDPTFQGQRSRHEASPEVYKQAYSELLPTLSLNSYYQRTRQEIFETDVAVYGDNLARFPSKGYELTLTQPIFRYGALVKLDQARGLVRGADLEFEAGKQGLIIRTAEAYVGVLEAYDNLEYTRSQEESVKKHFELAKERYSNGLAPITDFHDAKARLAYMSALRTEAENGLQDAIAALTVITGKEIDNPARLIFGRNTDSTGEQGPYNKEMPLSNPDPDDVDEWIKAAREQNLEVQVRQQDLLVAEQEIQRQRAGHLPTVSFIGQIKRDYEGGSLYGGDSDIEERAAIIQLNLPIFRGFSVRSKIREARKLSEAAEQDLEKEVRFARLEASSAFQGVKAAIKYSEALRQSVVSHEVALGAKKDGFKSGLFPSLAILDAERDLYQAKLEYAKARYDYILNSLYLKRAVGTLSPEDIEEINQWLE